MKERNHVVLAMLRSGKGSQVHEKTKKAKRRREKVDLQKEF